MSQVKVKRKKASIKHRFYCIVDLDNIDKRTIVGKTIQFLNDRLQTYVGKGSIITDLLIHRIIYKTIRLSLYETDKLTNESPNEIEHYLSMSNSFRSDLQLLAKFADQPKPPDLDGYLKEIYGETRHNNSAE